MRNQPVDQEDENDEVADPKLADLCKFRLILLISEPLNKFPI